MSVALVDLTEHKVDEVGLSANHDRALHAEDISSDHFGFHASTVIVDWNVCSLELLVLRLAEFVLGLKVDPQLEAVRPLLEAGRHLCMDNAPASRHPLDVSCANDASSASEVFVVDFTFKHVRHSLEATMGVVWEPSWKLDVEKIQHQEGVQVVQVAATNDSANPGTVTFALLTWLERLGQCLKIKLC